MAPNNPEEREIYFLPEEAKTSAGATFYPVDDRWEVWSGRGILIFDFSDIPGMSKNLKEPLKIAVSWYLQHRAPQHARNMFKLSRHLFAEMLVQTGVPVESINNLHLMGYRNRLGSGREYYLSSLAGLLKKWHALGHPGVEDSAVDYLHKVRLRGNKKGAAVLTMDPFEGPFTDLEFDAIHASLTEALRKSVLGLEDYVATRLFMIFGARPVQVALLKVCDLMVVDNPDGTKTYSLMVPRAKQRGSLPRGSFKPRPLIADLGALIVEHCRRICLRFHAAIGDAQDAPMFPLDSPNTDAPSGLEWHIGSAALSDRVTKAFTAIAPMSERTGEAIHITPIRFRRTLGTRAAAEGHGTLVIAEMLDHTDTQNVQVYVEARPEIAERIDKAMAMQMAPIAQAFAGAIDFGDKTRPRITDPRFDATHPVGSCGQNSYCAFSAPIACYTCAHFNAWVEGPHEAILGHLINEEERQVKVADDRIALINRRSILAVAQVVRLCDEHKQGRVCQ